VALKPCSTPGCPDLVERGRCSACTARAERRRGSARERGYDHHHETRFRRVVLARDPICVLCSKDWSTDADHYPLDRRELVRRGLDPNDPRHGRGLCHSCHSAQTAKHQSGGWNTS